MKQSPKALFFFYLVIIYLKSSWLSVSSFHYSYFLFGENWIEKCIILGLYSVKISKEVFVWVNLKDFVCNKFFKIILEHVCD